MNPRPSILQRLAFWLGIGLGFLVGAVIELSQTERPWRPILCGVSLALLLAVLLMAGFLIWPDVEPWAHPEYTT